MKKGICLLLIGCILFSWTAVLAGEPVTMEVRKDFTIQFEGIPFTAFDVNGKIAPPLYRDGTTYLPVRALANLAGGTVEWDGAAREIRIFNTMNIPCVFQKGLDEFLFSENKITASIEREVRLFYQNKEYVPKDVNGTIVPPVIADGTTYLPVRSVCEMAGMQVEWDEENKVISLFIPENMGRTNVYCQYIMERPGVGVFIPAVYTESAQNLNNKIALEFMDDIEKTENAAEETGRFITFEVYRHNGYLSIVVQKTLHDSSQGYQHYYNIYHYDEQKGEELTAKEYREHLELTKEELLIEAEQVYAETFENTVKLNPDWTHNIKGDREEPEMYQDNSGQLWLKIEGTDGKTVWEDCIPVTGGNFNGT